ncbi:hypothetical protein [Iningainema tapete]|uniref:Uncharacterized protein n=1 Tax=Iningainema tapete BLCC-T55 TaxID=2748662 RepID=A0A8J6XMI5_9CYAN|nr:hypothetical protein [Iningainema tapete]MBD2775616.1 hypothetical protein [Iningainema tapete BLCC-T55]
MSRSQEPNELYQFLIDFENSLTKIIDATGFGRVGIVVETIRNRKGAKKFALILEGQPSYRYVFNIEQFYDFRDWKLKKDSENS